MEIKNKIKSDILIIKIILKSFKIFNEHLFMDYKTLINTNASVFNLLKANISKKYS